MIEKGIKRKTKCICVPHGTISKFFSKFDKIYKKIISDTLIFNSKNRARSGNRSINSIERCTNSI